jgi:hypothetical protein
LVVLYASSSPDPSIFTLLSGQNAIALRESFTTQGVLSDLPGTQLVILDTVMETSQVASVMVRSAIENAGIPIASPQEFLQTPEEWLSRARLASHQKVTFLPPRQINFVGWSGGVGKSTLALLTALRFRQATRLPVALFELSPVTSSLQVRFSLDIPDFYQIATGKTPHSWQGVDLYPASEDSVQVLLTTERERVQMILDEIRSHHTLIITDAYPAHPLWPLVSGISLTGTYSFAVASPRDDALANAQQVITTLQSSGAAHADLLLNQVRSPADQAGLSPAVMIDWDERRVRAADGRITDRILAHVYTGWRAK